MNPPLLQRGKQGLILCTLKLEPIKRQKLRRVCEEMWRRAGMQHHKPMELETTQGIREFITLPQTGRRAASVHCTLYTHALPKKDPEKNCMGKASFLVVPDRHGLAELFVMQEKRPAKHTSLVSQNLQSLIRWHERRNEWDPKDL